MTKLLLRALAGETLAHTANLDDASGRALSARVYGDTGAGR